MSRQSMFIVIRSDRTCRIAKRPRLAGDEVAIPLDLIFPDTWGRVLHEKKLTLTVPDFVPEAQVHDEEEEEATP